MANRHRDGKEAPKKPEPKAAPEPEKKTVAKKTTKKSFG